MDAFRFAAPIYLWLLGLIPFCLIALVLSTQKDKRAIEQLGGFSVFKNLAPYFVRLRGLLTGFLLLAALTFIILALAKPQIGSRIADHTALKQKGVEVIVALDVSNSMLAQDFKPNRLACAKATIVRMLDNFKNNHIGLIVFAGKAYVQLPLTDDYAAAKLFLDAVNPAMIPAQGTAIGEAIELAGSSFSSNNERSKALIVITDGEDHEPGAVEAAQAAKKEHVVVYTVGMGSVNGSPIPKASDYQRDENGTIVVTKLNETTLQSIAQAGGGMYVYANNNTDAAIKIMSKVNEIEKTALNSMQYGDYKELFQYFLAIGFGLLLVYAFIPESKFNYFCALMALLKRFLMQFSKRINLL